MTSLSSLDVVSDRPELNTLRTAAILFVCFTLLPYSTQVSGESTNFTDFYQIKPLKGPQDGGTKVSIQISKPDYYTPTEVWFGVYLVSVGNRFDNDFIYVTTPNVSSNDTGVPQSVSVRFLEESSPVPTGLNFTFYPNPEIDSISPRPYIYYGGVILTVLGRGLDISESPILEVTTVTSLLIDSIVQANRITYQSICSNFTNTQMKCVLPTLYVPDGISSYLQSILPTFGTVGNGTFSVPEAVKSLVDRGHVNDGLNNTMYVYVGLIFDDNVEYRNLTSRLYPNGSTAVIAGPIIQKWNTSVKVMAWKNSDFTIQGEMLTYGCDVEDYAVYLEGIKCDIQQITDSGVIVITLPADTDTFIQQPELFPHFVCDGPNDLHLQVSVGYRWYDVACITPLTPCSSRPCLNNGKCDHGSEAVYKCECSGGYYGLNCEFDIPRVLSLSPRYGPRVGGTTVTIVVTIPYRYFDLTGVFFGDTSVTAGSKEIPEASSTAWNWSTWNAESLIVVPSGNRSTVQWNYVTWFYGGYIAYVSGQVPSIIFHKNIIDDEGFMQLCGDELKSVVLVSHGNDTTDIIIKTPASLDERAVPVTLSFDWSDPTDKNSLTTFTTAPNSTLTFTFFPNPIISEILPYEYLYTGTTTMTVNGTNLKSVVTPYLNVTMTTRWQVIGEQQTEQKAYFLSLCNATSNTTMTCPFPIIDIPTDLIAYLDQLPYANESRQQVDLNCSDRMFLPTKLTSGTFVQFLAGFILDGLTEYLSYDVVRVYPPPSFCFNRTLAPLGEPTYSILGNHLLRGVTSEDYSVVIGYKGVPQEFAWLRFAAESFTVTDTKIELHQYSIDGLLTTPDNGSWDCSSYYFLNLMVVVAGIEYRVGCANPSDEKTCSADLCENGGTCVQHAIKAECLCTNESVGEYCQYGIPKLNEVTPASGPKDGGTLITIKGEYYNYSTPIEVTFNSPVNFKTMNFTRYGNDIILRTPPLKYSSASTSNVTITVTFSTINYEKSVNIVVNKTFTYLPNPSIKSFTPSHHFVTGGTAVRMLGSNLNVSSEITMTIVVQTVFRTTDLEGDVIMVTSNQTFPTACDKPTDTSQALRCLMPVTQVPTEFYPLLGNQVNASDKQGPRRRRRSAAIQTVDTSGRRVHRRGRRYSQLISPSSGAVMKVFVLMQFDGHMVNLSNDDALRDNATLVLHRPPIIDVPSDVISYYPRTDQQVEIVGENITVGTNWNDDLSAKVGGISVLIVNCSSRMIRLSLPNTPDGMDNLVDANLSAYANRCRADGQQLAAWVDVSKVYALEIEIGFKTFPAGCIHYADTIPPAEETSTLMGTYVGIAFGVAILVTLSFAACNSSGSTTTPG